MTAPPADRDDAAEDAAQAGELETSRFFERVAYYRRAIEHERFLGENPTVRPRRRDRLETAAAAIASERVNGILQLQDELISPAEDVAEAELEAGMRALTTWSFAAAGRAFDRASAVSQLPRLQQEITLGRGLLALASDIFWFDPHDPGSWRGADQAIAGLLPTLDRLDPEKAEHYAADVRRLTETWRSASEDTLLWCGWALMRARVAGQLGARESALAWLLRAYEPLQAGLAGSERLGTLIACARSVFQMILLGQGEGGEEERTALEELAARASPRELQASLVAATEERLGVDLTRLRGRFVLALYQSFGDSGGAA
ncbi:MAG TPA: hypothetical protein VKU87_06935 [Thermomicrobiaceae bacterium]|nr:hypothetical protein [Thermomicrobiaceae bacterium]